MTPLPPLPDHKTPGWEFTDLSGLDFESYGAVANGATGAGAEHVLALREDTTVLRQVDSHAPETPAFGTADGEGAGEPVVMSLSDAREQYPEIVSKHLGSLAPADDPFVARNDAAWSGGAFVYVPKGVTASKPIDLTAVLGSAGSGMAWRVLIVMDEDAEAEVTEQYISDGAELDALLNSVVEIVLGPASRLRYLSAQGLSESSWVFANQRADIGRDANLEWITLGFGSARGKVRMETRLTGQGSSAKVTGAYAGAHEQHLDFHTRQEHAAPDTVSDLAFRGVLDDKATSVWRGMIRVDPGAQRTDAFQENRNLLLSKSAHADAIPGLEIEADDVRCTHAAAVAQIDLEQLHYLRSRGMPEAAAKSLIIEGFLGELVERIPEGTTRDSVAAALERRLAEILG